MASGHRDLEEPPDMPKSETLSRPQQYRDRSADWYAYYDGERRKEIRQILDEHPELIDEHEANPNGYRNHHSPLLQRVLNYFRQAPVLGKYYIYASVPWKEYRIAVISERGKAPEVLEAPVFGSEEEAMHGVLLKRIEDLRA
jgi:branched-chain amino acid transport system permease protein